MKRFPEAGHEMRSVLFLCVANSARSQMAEGLAHARFGDHVRVQSAGSRPLEVDPLPVAVMHELEIDISGQRSKSVDTIDSSSVDLVVTLCAEEVCPTFLGSARKVHWVLPEPVAATGSEAERLASFRRVRDEIAMRLRTLEVTTSPGDDPATSHPR